MITRFEAIVEEIKKLQDELDSLPEMDRLTEREFAEKAGITLEAAILIKQGKLDTVDTATLRKALHFMENCPICGTYAW